MGVIIAALALLVLALFFVFRTDWQPAFTGADGVTASRIQVVLDDANIPNRTNPAAGEVLVPAHLIDQARVAVLISPLMWNVGYNFRDAAAGYVREGEIAAMLARISFINSATMRLNIPNVPFYATHPVTSATASVQVSGLRPLTPSDGQSIALVVSRMVEGLTLDNITVFDDGLNILFDDGMPAATEVGGVAADLAFEIHIRQVLRNAVHAVLQPMFDEVNPAFFINIEWGAVNSVSTVFESPLGPGNTVGLHSWEEVIERSEMAQDGVGPTGSSFTQIQESERRANQLHNMTETIREWGNIPGQFLTDYSSVAIVLTDHHVYHQGRVTEMGLLGDLDWRGWEAEMGTGGLTTLPNHDELISLVSMATGIPRVQIIAQYRNHFIDDEAVPLLSQDNLLIMAAVLVFVLFAAFLLISRTRPEIIEETPPELYVEDMLMSSRLEEEKATEIDRNLEIQNTIEIKIKKYIDRIAAERPETLAQLMRNWTNHKAAILLIALGPKKSSAVFKHLKEDEIEAVTLEIAKAKLVMSDVTHDVLNEFYEMCLAQKHVTEGGVDHAKQILEEAVGEDKAAEIISKVSEKPKSKPKPFDFIKKVDANQILAFIQLEHPQVIALVLSHLRPAQASAILVKLSPAKRADVAKRIALMDKTSPDIIKEVEAILEKKLSGLDIDDYDTTIGGLDFVVNILNSMDRNSEKDILDTLQAEDGRLSEEIRKKMFAFGDIINMDNRSIQRVLREGVDNRDLAIALKGATSDMKTFIFNNMSKRLASMIQEEMDFVGPARKSDVEVAQQKVVDVIRRLHDNGEIIIGRGGGEELFV